MRVHLGCNFLCIKMYRNVRFYIRMSRKQKALNRCRFKAFLLLRHGGFEPPTT